MRSALIFLLLTTTLQTGCHKPQQANRPSAVNQTATSTISTGHDADATFPVVDNSRFYVVPDYRLNAQKNVTLTLT